MTVQALHRRLQKLLDEGHGRKPVCIDKKTFGHNCEGDGVTILPVVSLGLVGYTIDDGDGCATINADGTERRRVGLVLVGDLYAP